MTLQALANSRAVILAWNQSDDLYRGYLAGILGAPLKALEPRPAPANVWAWQRWLRQHDQAAMYLCDPSWAAFGPAAAAVSRERYIYVVFTQTARLSARPPAWWLGHEVTAWICPTEAMAQYLRQRGWDQRRVRVLAPAEGAWPGPPAVSAAPDAGRVLLALPRPDDLPALRTVVWAATMLRHAGESVRVVVAGRCPRDCRRQILRWQYSWQTPDLVTIDEGEDAYRRWAGVCATVAAPLAPARYGLRWDYARRRAPVAAVAGAGAKGAGPTEFALPRLLAQRLLAETR